MILNSFVFFRNFFQLLCHLSENAAQIRTNSDKISGKIQRNFSASKLKHSRNFEIIKLKSLPLFSAVLSNQASSIQNLRMLHVHAPSQKFNKYNQNFSTLRLNKNLKKLTILKMSKTYILHNNNAEKLLTNQPKNNCPVNVTSFFHFK